MNPLSTALLTGLLLSTSLSAAPEKVPEVPEAQKTNGAEGIYRTPVTAFTVTTGSITDSTRLQGVIESTRTPRLKTHVSAEVTQVNVDEGDTVQKGDLLAKLDDKAFKLDAQAAEADIARLNARLDNLKQSLKRTRTLHKQKLVAQSKLDDANAALREAKAQLAQAQARLSQARYQLSHTRILAPIDGVVQKRSVSVGDYVNPMSPSSPDIFQLVDTLHLRARLYFPEALAGAAALDIPVTIHNGKERLEAHITHLRPMLESSNRALQALAEFTNLPGWRPGQSITADVVLSQHDQALIVPEQAVVQRRQGPVVYRLENGKAIETSVEPGIRQGDRIEILSGLHAGDRVAVDGAPFLANDVPVTVQTNKGSQA
ncbi:MAG: efflux RND transporter periplasmic adaptor subunit [bacterium]